MPEWALFGARSMFIILHYWDVLTYPFNCTVAHAFTTVNILRIHFSLRYFNHIYLFHVSHFTIETHWMLKGNILFFTLACMRVRCNARPTLSQVCVYPMSIRHWSSADLLLAQRLRRWPNNKSALGQCLMFAVPHVLSLFHTVRVHTQITLFSPPSNFN